MELINYSFTHVRVILLCPFVFGHLDTILLLHFIITVATLAVVLHIFIPFIRTASLQLFTCICGSY